MSVPSLENRYREADQALKRNEPARAAEILRELVEIEPREPLFHWRLAYALSELREFPRAIVEFHRTLKLDPRNIAAWGGLGRVYMELRLWDLAEEAIQHRLDLKESPQHFVFFSYIMLQKKSYEKAAEACLRAIGLDPDFSEAYYNLGLAFRHRDQLDEATKAFEKAVDLDDHQADGFRELGLSYLGAGKLVQARSALESCLHLNATDAWANFYLALCLDYLGDLESAATYFEAAIQERPGDPEIQRKFQEFVRRKNALKARKRSSDGPGNDG
jgi:superkiller protein 3